MIWTSHYGKWAMVVMAPEKSGYEGHQCWPTAALQLSHHLVRMSKTCKCDRNKIPILYTRPHFSIPSCNVEWWKMDVDHSDGGIRRVCFKFAIHKRYKNESGILQLMEYIWLTKDGASRYTACIILLYTSFSFTMPVLQCKIPLFLFTVLIFSICQKARYFIFLKMEWKVWRIKSF